MKKRQKSADTLDNFMSELPFSLTSPTAWKELGCVYSLPMKFLLKCILMSIRSGAAPTAGWSDVILHLLSVYDVVCCMRLC